MDFGIIEELDKYEMTIKIGETKFVISREDYSSFYNELGQLIKKYSI